MPMIQQIPISELHHHPRNPRLVMREDVIDAIVAGLADGFHESHSLQVHKNGDGYQILSGHHRAEAAKRSGLDTVPCWVRDDLDEAGAYMLLATANNQGELSPLEIGMHALNYVDKSAGGRGKKGGLSAYANSVGRSRQPIERYRDAARVAEKVHHKVQVSELLDKAAHLAAIHKLPETTWGDAVAVMLKKKWSAADTADNVKAAKDQPTDKRALAIFAGNTSRKSLARIDEIRDTFATAIKSASIRQEWLEWFAEEDPLDLVEVKRKRDELEEREAAGDPPVAQLADAIEWLNDQPQCDLLLTDPPYSTDVEDVQAFAESWLPLALSKVKPTGRAYVCIGAYPEEIAAYCSVAMPTQILVWTYRNTLGPTPTHKYNLNWQAILYYQGADAPKLDSPEMMEQMAVQDINAPDGRQGDRFHTWQKPSELAERIIRHSTTQGATVIDPFCCTGTFILAAQKLGRTGKGCDNSAENLEIAKERGCHIEG